MAKESGALGESPLTPALSHPRTGEREKEARQSRGASGVADGAGEGRLMDVEELHRETGVMALAVTIAALEMEPRRAFDRLGEMGFRWVQLSATMAGMRPRELDRSARRDLKATLRRKEMGLAGIDIWIPQGHFVDSANVDRAAAAALDAIGLAADLGRCPVSLTLPGVEEGEKGEGVETVIGALVEQAGHVGVELADHAVGGVLRAGVGVGIDPAAYLAVNDDPAAAVAKAGEKLAAARLCDLLVSGMRGPIGDAQEGMLDVMAYRVALSLAAGLRAVVVDARQWFSPWEGLEQTAAVWEAAGR